VPVVFHAAASGQRLVGEPTVSEIPTERELHIAPNRRGAAQEDTASYGSTP